MGQHSLAFCCVLPLRCDRIISIADHSDDANANQDTNTNMNVKTNTNTNICGSAYIFPQHSFCIVASSHQKQIIVLQIQTWMNTNTNTNIETNTNTNMWKYLMGQHIFPQHSLAFYCVLPLRCHRIIPIAD